MRGERVARLMAWPMCGLLSMALLALAGGMGCGATDPDPDLDCMEGDVAISEAIHARWSDPNACATHSDCVHTSTDVHCPDDGATRLGCRRVVHHESVDDFGELLEEVKADLCPRIDPRCFGGAICFSTLPRCVDGLCTGIVEHEVDAGPADAGLADGG